MSVTKSPTVIRPRLGSQGATLRLYNFVWIHWSLRVTPAMAAGVTDQVWDPEDRVLS
jgi:hypothetical protein